MCTGKCSRFVGLSLIPLSLVCMVANALLLVPQGKTNWTNVSNLSLQVWLMAGFVGGGLMVSGWAPRCGVLGSSGVGWGVGMAVWRDLGPPTALRHRGPVSPGGGPGA